MQPADVLLRFEPLPQHTGDVLRGRNRVSEIRRVEIQVVVIKLFEDFLEHSLQVKEVDHHARAPIDFSRNRHLEQVVMSMTRLIVAGAEDGSIAGGIPGFVVVPVRSRKLNSLRQENGRHLVPDHVEKGPGS